MVYLTSEADFGRRMQQAQKTEKSTPWYSWIWQRRTKLLGVALVVLLILFIIQWYAIRWFITATVELFEPQFIQRMPEDIKEAEIAQRINQVKVVVKKMPMSLVSGQMSWRKVNYLSNLSHKKSPTLQNNLRETFPQGLCLWQHNPLLPNNRLHMF